MNKFKLSEKQAQAILDMRLQRLTGLEREKLDEEYKILMEKIEYYRSVLADETMVYDIIKEEINIIKDKYSDGRRTDISASDEELEMEDLIADEDVVITISHNGYIKRMPTDTYKSQRRGGKGITAMTTKGEDFVEQLFITSTHNYLMFFTNKGKVYRLKVYEIPESGRQSKGTAIINLLYITGDEKITTVIPVKQYTAGSYLLAATKNGIVKKTELTDYDTSRKDGIIALTLDENDELIGVQQTNGEEEIILVTKEGMSIRFNEQDVRPMGRTARGVRGINLKDDDAVVGMDIVREGSQLLVITEKGYGKRTPVDEYKTQTRGSRVLLP